MPRAGETRRLLACFALALALAGAWWFAVPRAWVARWLSPYAGRAPRPGAGAAATLTLLPELAAEPESAPVLPDSAAVPSRPVPETMPAAGWWDAALRERRAAAANLARPAPPPAPLDLLAARLLSAVPDSVWRRARADTSRAARLALVRQFYAADLRRNLPSLLGAMATRKTTDILNREAELFGEYLLVR